MAQNPRRLSLAEEVLGSIVDRLSDGTEALEDNSQLLRVLCGRRHGSSRVRSHWTCLFANDIDPKKALSYATNWGEQQVVVRDVAHLNLSELPGVAASSGRRFLARIFLWPAREPVSTVIALERSGRSGISWRLCASRSERRA